jgi:phosphoenolpyruvate carboxylase
MSPQDAVSPELRDLVKWSVALLGRVIEKEAGSRLFSLIESLRKDMAELRESDDGATFELLRSRLAKLEALKPAERELVARSYTLMLELMNACENAHRSHRLAGRAGASPVGERGGPEAVFYVLTAHPTEARSPHNIAVFREIQRLLALVPEDTVPRTRLERQLFHMLEVAWRAGIVRDRAPKVRHEAEHVYSTLLQEDVLQSLLQASEEIVPVYIRSWVGGDKDGHPGVDEKAMRESLGLSRAQLIRYVESRLVLVRTTLDLMPGRALSQEMAAAQRALAPLRRLADGDAARVQRLRRALASLAVRYEKRMGCVHPQLRRLRQLLHVFPGLVVPLELRESSDMLLSHRKPDGKLAIDRMLRSLARLARGGDPRWYARSLIVSMASQLEHLQVAADKARAAFKGDRLPVVPLFESADALERAPEIAQAVLDDARLGRAVRGPWEGRLEMMVGYSDSAKESGVLSSRLAIAGAMRELDAVCSAAKVKPLFFQGSGGSVDRGGGSVAEQTAWWPHSALRLYKVTLQGEMVERSFASPQIARGQVERIFESARDSLSRPPRGGDRPELKAFADRVAAAYRSRIQSPDFLEIVEKATPYSRLSDLKIGSRPSSRQKSLSVKSLRAIPWVLCWTQTRVLFPTWWGVGTAWKESDEKTRAALRKAADEEPVFGSYLKALGFTLAKVEMPVWRLYIERSALADKKAAFALFEKEYRLTRDFLSSVTGQKEPLWFRPWLAASIRLRSPMIHPLNLLQLLAMESGDAHLLRLTVTGVASGMLTTG